jgi:leucyl-tRNA synthetase
MRPKIISKVGRNEFSCYNRSSHLTNCLIGVFTGLYSRHPLTNEQLPIYVAPYVLSDYGTGAVMAVPAHDKRDWEFAKANNIVDEIKFVVDPLVQEEGAISDRSEPFLGHGVLNAASGKYQGMRSSEAMEAVIAEAKEKNFGDSAVQYRLRDWLLSRQRYWGAPIPIIHCPSCKVSQVFIAIMLPYDRPERLIFFGNRWYQCLRPTFQFISLSISL